MSMPLPLLIAAAAAAIAATLPAADGFTVPARAVLPSEEEHPCLWFDRAGAAGFLAARRAGAGAAAAVAAHPLLAAPLPDPPSSTAKEPVQGYYGSTSQIAVLAAWMSLWETDPAARMRWRERACAALERLYRGPIYTIDPQQKDTGVDEIYRGTWLQNAVTAYDWVAGDLPRERFEELRKPLAAEAQWLHENLDRLSPRPHNHLTKPAWGLGSAAIALANDPRARSWLEHALAASNAGTAAYFTADGIYREGAHYYIFCLVNMVPFLYHYRNACGVDLFPAMRPAFEWPLAVRSARGWMPNIEDSFIRPFPGRWVAGAYRGAATWLAPGGDLAGVLTWNEQATDHAPFVASELRTGRNFTGASVDFPLALIDLLTWTDGIAPTAPTASPTVFLRGGQSVLRDRWISPKRSLLFHGVAVADNHDHHDSLSVILEGEGQLMACDAGYTRETYKDRKAWYMTAEAHNVVTLDGAVPGDPAPDRPPVSADRLDGDFLRSERKTAPFPTKGGWIERTVALVGVDVVVVADRGWSTTPGEWAVRLHGGRGTMSGASDWRRWSIPQDDYGAAASLHARLIYPGATLADRSGEVTYIKGDYASFGYVRASRGTGTSFAGMQVLFPRKPDAECPAVADIPAEGAAAVRIAGRDLIACRLGDGRWSAGGWTSDARLLVVREEGAQLHLALIGATVLARNGRSWLQADRAVALSLSWNGSHGRIDFAQDATGDATFDGGAFDAQAQPTAGGGCRVEVDQGRARLHLERPAATLTLVR